MLGRGCAAEYTPVGQVRESGRHFVKFATSANEIPDLDLPPHEYAWTRRADAEQAPPAHYFFDDEVERVSVGRAQKHSCWHCAKARGQLWPVVAPERSVHMPVARSWVQTSSMMPQSVLPPKVITWPSSVSAEAAP